MPTATTTTIVPQTQIESYSSYNTRNDNNNNTKSNYYNNNNTNSNGNNSLNNLNTNPNPNPFNPQTIPQNPDSAISSADYSTLSQLIDTLVPTKDSIRTAKQWVVTHENLSHIVVDFIRKRMEGNVEFSVKLNILYLINDVLHHVARSKIEGGGGEDVEDSPYLDAFQSQMLGIIAGIFVGGISESEENKVFQVMSIWWKKGIFTQQFIEEIQNVVKSTASAKQADDFLNQFQPSLEGDRGFKRRNDEGDDDSQSKRGGRRSRFDT